MEMSTRKHLLFPSPESPAAQDPSGSKRLFRPYTSLDHHVTKGRYITSNDPRGYIPVYEYPLHGQWIMMDMDDGYVLWTGIWKALGNSKADIVKMVESEPDLASRIRRVRGGYLKIQGTWMPYEVALRLSRRVAWHIRYDLVPLFGPTFPSTCMSPDQPGFGQIISGDTRRRRTRRIPLPPQTTTSSNWTIISPSMPAGRPVQRPLHAHPSIAPKKQDKELLSLNPRRQSLEHEVHTSSRPQTTPKMNASSPSHARHTRYNPYQLPHPKARFFPSIVYGPHHYVDSETKREFSDPGFGITHPDLAIPPTQRRPSRVSVTLPSVSDLLGISNSKFRDTATTVLERLRSDETDMRSSPNYHFSHSAEFSSTLSPFCPLPEGARSATQVPFNTLPTLHVPVDITRDRISPSSPTFSGSTITGGDISPTTPGSTGVERLGMSRSPLNGLDWSTGQSNSPPLSLLASSGDGSANPVTPKQRFSVPSAPPTADSVSPLHSISSDESSPHLRACTHGPVPTYSASRPLRPW